MPDANKTQLTRQITTAALTWLDVRGFRPVETEVQVAQGWVADVAGFCYPTRTEAQALKLIGKPPDWHKYKHNDRLEEFEAAHSQWMSTYAALPSPLTAVVEVKASLQDLRRDPKFESAARRMPANLLYLATTADIANRTHTGDWGVLVLDAAGAVRLRLPPRLYEIPAEQTLRLVCQVAMRRDNFTRQARWKEFKRQAREDDNGRINRNRLSTAMQIVLLILDGTPVSEALDRHGRFEAPLPDWEMKRLRELAEKAKPLIGNNGGD